MKKYTYNLFPKHLVVAGYILIILSIVYILVSILLMENIDNLNVSAPVAFIIIGFIIVSFKSKIIIDNNFRFIIKESILLNMTFSKERVCIPGDCNKIIIKKIIKKGTGYYRFVLPVNYSFKSYDMFLVSGSSVVRLINTDYPRSLKIAEFFKTNFSIEYILK